MEIETNLDNIIIGKNIRMFQCQQLKYERSDNGSLILSKTPSDSYYCMRQNSYSKDELRLIKENNLSYHYFMKDNMTTKLNCSYNNEFINELTLNLQSNKSNGSNLSIYYDKEIMGLEPKQNSNFVQFGQNYYFINENVFSSPQNNFMIQGKYDFNSDDNLKNKPELRVNIKNNLKNYISTTYNQNFYDDSLTFVNDKSIPVYDLQNDALSKIQVLKFQNSSIVDSIINKFNLNELRDKILYNSKTNTLSNGYYDSLYIQPILEYYLNDESLWDSERDKKLKEFFDFVFSNLSLESFYRLLIPVGKISNISNWYTYNQPTRDITEYAYYINVDNIESLNRSINFNYFTLKNLKNPHNEYDYEVFDINEDDSLFSFAYDYKETTNYNVLNFVSETISSLREYIDSTHAGIISGAYIDDNNLIPIMIAQSQEKYNNWSATVVKNAIESEGSWLRFRAFLNYFKIIYDKDLNSDPYIITTDDLLSNVDSKLTEFKSLYKDTLEGDDYLDVFYKNGLKMLNEIKESILTYANVNNIENVKSKNIFISKQQALILKNSSLSITFDDKMNNFKHSLYKPFAQTILNKNEINDRYTYSTKDWYKEKYPIRFSGKLNDYLNSYNDLFLRENIMKKDGNIFGYRTYNIVNTSLNKKIYLTYNYISTFDKKLLIKNDLLGDVVIEDAIGENAQGWEFDRHDIDEINSSLKDIAAYKINNDIRLKLENNDKIDQFIAIYKTLKEMPKVEFIDYIEGFHKYKEVDLSKSNVYSIELVNSNLNYELFTYSEVINLILLGELYNENEGWKYDNLTLNFVNVKENISKSFIDVIHEAGYNEILDITMNKDIEILKKSGYDIPYSSYKYYDVNNPMNENIETKMEMRKQVETAIRTSIHRYAPVNTTLWKIKYSGDNYYNK